MARLSNLPSDSGRKSKTRNDSKKSKTPIRSGRRQNATEGQVDRRRFLRQSAEIAALSLFGTMGLDAVVQRVAQRMETMRGIDSLADRILAGTGVAYASDGSVTNDGSGMLTPAPLDATSCPS